MLAKLLNPLDHVEASGTDDGCDDDVFCCWRCMLALAVPRRLFFPTSWKDIVVRYRFAEKYGYKLGGWNAWKYISNQLIYWEGSECLDLCDTGKLQLNKE